MKEWVPPWVGSRYRYVRRADGSADVIDTGDPGNPKTEYPQFVCNCETVPMAEKVCEAMEAYSQREEGA